MELNHFQQFPKWIQQNVLVWLQIIDESTSETKQYSKAIILDFESSSFKVKIQIEDSKTEKIVSSENIFLRILKPKEISNLIDIKYLNDAEILNHLKINFKNDQIYCYCGSSLVITNPYKSIDSLTNSKTFKNICKDYLREQILKSIPHIWTMAAKSLHCLKKNLNKQAICINGESGAGKTVATKMVLEFLSKLQEEIIFENRRRSTMNRRQSMLKLMVDPDQLEFENENDFDSKIMNEKVIVFNNLLEVFGNAKTCRNDNSSRFGKFIKLYFNKNENLKLNGTSMQNFLLEKSRVIKFNHDERTFHIFYIIFCLSVKELNEIGLTEIKNENEKSKVENEIKNFKFYQQSKIFKTKKIDDNNFLKEMRKGFEFMEIDQSSQSFILKLISMIIFIFELEIDDSSYEEGKHPCKIIHSAELEKIKNILQLEGNSIFEESLLYKKIKVNLEEIKTPNSPHQIKKLLNVFAKEVYNNLFNWIFLKINQILKSNDLRNQNSSIGILDIFGFEIFEKNSLEQLFINYANERLQGLYVQQVFKNECIIFENEGLQKFIKLIKFEDNANIIENLDCKFKNPIGVFALLNQTSRLNMDDKKFVETIKKEHSNKSSVSFHRFKKDRFYVKHTAREVEYFAEDFVNKNMDEVSQDIENIFKFSKNKFFKEIMRKESFNKEKFLAEKFVNDMENLILELKESDCHFVRCIKPNEQKTQNFFVDELVLKQIKYMGLLDSLNVRKNNFPFRYQFKEFYLNFQSLDNMKEGSYNFTQLMNQTKDFKTLCQQILTSVTYKNEDLLIGKNLIFMTNDCFQEMQTQLDIKTRLKKKAVKTIYSFFRENRRRQNINLFFREFCEGMKISKDVLTSIKAKVKYLNFKKFRKVTMSIQKKYLITKSKRQLNLKKHNIRFLVKVSKKMIEGV